MYKQDFLVQFRILFKNLKYKQSQSSEFTVSAKTSHQYFDFINGNSKNISFPGTVEFSWQIILK